MEPSIIFMGTPEFAVASLRKIHEVYSVKAVVTTPDKPQGRGLQLKGSPVKEAALELDIPVLQPASLRSEEFREQMESLQPDIIAVVAFRILPSSIYTLARLGAFNIHGSLLPKYRGAAPINWAIIHGEKETGVTSFLLADKVDTGSILDTRTIPIPDGMTAGELHDALMPLAAELALATCQNLVHDMATPMPQNNAEATLAPKIHREDCHLDWNQPTRSVRNFIHGMSPYPGAWTRMEGKTLKVLRASFSNKGLMPSEFLITDTEFLIGCLDGALCVLELQMEGKRMMHVEEFLRGYRGSKMGMFA